MFRTLNTDNTDAEYIIVGARSQNSNLDCASIVLANYDDDTKQTYRLGEIAIRDHYGNSTQNGFGNMIFKTNGTGGLTSVEDRMIIMNNGNIGIGTNNPQAKLHVNGDMLANITSMQTIPQTKITSTDFETIYSWITPSTVSKVSVYTSISDSGSYDMRIIDTSNNILGALTASNTILTIYDIPLSNTAPIISLQIKKNSGNYVSLNALNLLHSTI